MFFKTRKKILLAGHTTHIETYFVQKHIESLIPYTQTIVIDKKLPLYLCRLLGISHIPACKPNFIDYLSKLTGDRDFCLIWYPSAGLFKWKTGAFVFSNLKQAHLFNLGIDYSTKSIVIDSFMNPVNEKKQIEEYINVSKQTISRYTPYVLTSDEAFKDIKQTASLFTNIETPLLLIALCYLHMCIIKRLSTKIILHSIILCVFHFVIIMSNASDIKGVVSKIVSLSEPLLTISTVLLAHCLCKLFTHNG